MYKAPIETVESTHYELTAEEIKALKVVSNLITELEDNDIELFMYEMTYLREALETLSMYNNAVLYRTDGKFEIRPEM